MQRINPLLAVPVALLALGATALFSDDHDKKTDVTISQPVEIPGGTILAPGSYMFILNNSASNRSIIEIKSEDGKQLYAMLLAQRATRLERTGKTVLTFYEMPQGQPVALRQWFWPGDFDGQEFLYRHNEAVKIDQASNQTAPEATDQEYAAINSNSGNAAAAPAAIASSDQTSASHLTQTNATQTTVAQADTVPTAPARSDATVVAQTAQQPDPANQPPAAALVAQNTPPPAPLPAPVVDAPSSTLQASTTDQSPATLPQTASHFPLIGGLGLMLLAAAGALRMSRQGA